MDAALRTDWGDSFWSKFYADKATRIVDPESLQIEGMWLGLTLKSRLGLAVDRIIDLGSGTGDFADGLDRALQTETRRIDLHSPDRAAERVDIRLVQLHNVDLIVCRDTLQCLEDASAAALLIRMNNSCADAIYLRVPTNKDQLTEDSDRLIALRAPGWYVSHLTNYAHLRFGIWIRRITPIRLAALE